MNRNNIKSDFDDIKNRSVLSSPTTQNSFFKKTIVIFETYCLWRARKTVLKSDPAIAHHSLSLAHMKGLSLDHVGHRVLWTSTVHDLLGGVVWVAHVGPRDVTEVVTTFQFADGFTSLKWKRCVIRLQTSGIMHILNLNFSFSISFSDLQSCQSVKFSIITT